jgi:hypothetical protein
VVDRLEGLREEDGGGEGSKPSGDETFGGELSQTAANNSSSDILLTALLATGSWLR